MRQPCSIRAFSFSTITVSSLDLWSTLFYPTPSMPLFSRNSIPTTWARIDGLLFSIFSIVISRKTPLYIPHCFHILVICMCRVCIAINHHRSGLCFSCKLLDQRSTNLTRGCFHMLWASSFLIFPSAHSGSFLIRFIY